MEKKIKKENLNELIEKFKVNNSVVDIDDIKDLFDENLTESELEEIVEKFIENDIEINQKDILKDMNFSGDSYTGNLLTDYLQEIIQYPVLSKEKQVELVERVRKGDQEAREKLYLHNQRFVFCIARRYERYNLDVMDLVQEGNIGLEKAIQKYDPNKGASFITYAYFWINQAIHRAVCNKSNVIAMPTYFVVRQNKMNRAIEQYENIYNRKPTDEELCEILKITKEDLEKLRKYKRNLVSLESKINCEDGANEIKDFIKDEKASLAQDKILDKDEVEFLIKNTPKLTEMQLKVLSLLYPRNFTCGN